MSTFCQWKAGNRGIFSVQNVNKLGNTDFQIRGRERLRVPDLI